MQIHGMKKSQLRKLIKSIIREQNLPSDLGDNIDQKPKPQPTVAPQPPPPPGGKRATLDYACGWGPAPLPNCLSGTSQNIPYTPTNVIRVLDNGVWRDPLVGDILVPCSNNPATGLTCWDSCTHSCCNGGNGPECNILKLVVTSLIQTNYTGPIHDPWELTDCTPNCPGTGCPLSGGSCNDPNNFWSMVHTNGCDIKCSLPGMAPSHPCYDYCCCV
jgi:hypothetical protein